MAQPATCPVFRNDCVQLFPDTFKETPGTLPGKKVHLTTVEGASPVIRSACTLPQSGKDAVKAKPQRLVDTGMIVPVDEPTDWARQMSVAEKKSDIRICIDPCPLNKALKREHYKLPALEDILPELSQACKFSVCDLKAGYLHCELDHPSSLLTTFATPFGYYRWCRLPSGLTVSGSTRHWRISRVSTALQTMCSFGATQMKNMMSWYVCFYNAAVKSELLSTKTSAVLDYRKFHLWVT